MLPDDLFIGLIDVDLQNQIAESDDMDKDTMEALATLLNQGNATFVNNAKDWTMLKHGRTELRSWIGRRNSDGNGQV